MRWWRRLRQFVLAGLALDLAVGAAVAVVWLLAGCAAGPPSSVRPHNHAHSHGCGFHTHTHSHGHHATYGQGAGGCERHVGR